MKVRAICTSGETVLIAEDISVTWDKEACTLVGTDAIGSNLSDNFEIYPNPTNAYIYLDNSKNARIARIEITNALGKVIYVNPLVVLGRTEKTLLFQDQRHPNITSFTKPARIFTHGGFKPIIENTQNPGLLMYIPSTFLPFPKKNRTFINPLLRS